MNKFFNTVFCFILFLILVSCDRSNSSSAENNPDTKTDSTINMYSDEPLIFAKNVGSEVDKIVKEFPENASLGIVIQNIKTGERIYELNANRSFVPASVMKVLTATASINYLGPTFRYTTLLATQQSAIKTGVISGNLYLTFSGDPSLKSCDVDELLNSLRKKQIHQISGNIVIDTYPFIESVAGPGFMWDDENLCFAGPVNGIVLDRNCFKFNLYPSPVLSHQAILISQSLFTSVHLENTVRTKLGSNDTCYQTLESDFTNHYKLTGCIPYNKPELQFDVAIHDPQLVLVELIKKNLQKQHIKLNGTIIFARRPASLMILASHQSEPLSVLMQQMLKKSDNLYANTFFKTLGATYYDSDATWENGAAAVLAILHKLKIDTSYDIIADGAGLSRYNRLTPKTFFDIFSYIFHKDPNSEIFMQSLAYAGGYGTLQNLVLPNKAVSFQGKTGTMKNIKGLVGILNKPGRPPLMFVMMVNGSSPTKDYAHLGYQLLERLSQM
jgi:D-alanyl-D-alanine carboxypeptidase/D-alanyl-D-alanine-endopeptidase (penicillin-binding protein 4)